MPTWATQLPANTAITLADRFMFNDASDSENSKMNTIQALVDLTSLQTAYNANPEIVLIQNVALTINTKNYTALGKEIFVIKPNDLSISIFAIDATGSIAISALQSEVFDVKDYAPPLTQGPEYLNIEDGQIYASLNNSAHYAVWSLANPQVPIIEDEFTTNSTTVQIMRHGGFIYVLQAARLEVFDTANNLLVIFDRSQSTGTTFQNLRSMKFHGSILYVVDHGRSRVYQIEFGNVSFPVFYPDITGGTTGITNLTGVYDIAFCGELAFIISFDNDFLQSVDVENPRNPIGVDRVADGDSGGTINWVLDNPKIILATSNSIAIFNAEGGTLQIFDGRAPLDSAILSELEDILPVNDQIIQAQMNHFLITVSTLDSDKAFIMVNVFNVQPIVEIKTFTNSDLLISDSFNVLGHAIRGTIAYIGYSNPANPAGNSGLIFMAIPGIRIPTIETGYAHIGTANINHCSMQELEVVKNAHFQDVQVTGNLTVSGQTNSSPLAFPPISEDFNDTEVELDFSNDFAFQEIVIQNGSSGGAFLKPINVRRGHVLVVKVINNTSSHRAHLDGTIWDVLTDAGQSQFPDSNTDSFATLTCVNNAANSAVDATTDAITAVISRFSQQSDL